MYKDFLPVLRFSGSTEHLYVLCIFVDIDLLNLPATAFGYRLCVLACLYSHNTKSLPLPVFSYPAAYVYINSLM